MAILLLAFGFGFVIFWHELGHFLAAKWAGVKVEQFAVGFGHAMFSWRKGLGVRWGSSRVEYEARLREYLKIQEDANARAELPASDELQLEYAAAQLGLGETEYRLNWIPLGGYVKMLGQDDMDPTSQSESPRAYNKKPISKRMVIVSAGVVMNIILAVIFFTILFRIGFHVLPPVVGLVYPGSPAQEAGVRVGDRIVTYDNRWMSDFTKIQMYVALSDDGVATPMRVRRADGTEADLKITPRRLSSESASFLLIGLGPSPELRSPAEEPPTDKIDEELHLAGAVQPNETIIAVNGRPVKLNEYHVLDAALQNGNPVNVTVEDAEGQQQQRVVTPVFVSPFANQPLSLAGMMPRTVVTYVFHESSAYQKLHVGDIVDEIRLQPGNDPKPRPTLDELMKLLDTAGKEKFTVDVTVIRNGEKIAPITGLDPTHSLKDSGGRKGIQIGLKFDDEHPVIASVAEGSAADEAKIPAGSTINSVGGQPVQNWHDVQRLLVAAAKDQPLEITVTTESGDSKKFNLNMTADRIAAVALNRYQPADLNLHELDQPRKTANPIEAARWGMVETRDLMAQFYLTIHRMAQGSVPASGAMGPLGILQQGSRIAERGTDWLIWFLAMISANLAVVNFLPIPIVDGGLFVFLILEKLMGKPLSPRMQGIAQIVGLALIASVFVFVTYHDIYRWIQG